MSRHAATRERPRRQEFEAPRRVREPRPRMQPLTKWLVSIGVAATVLALGAQWTLHSSYFRVQHVTIVGLRHESAASVLAVSGLAQHPSMIGLNDATIVKRLDTFAWIDTVAVTKRWPNTVTLTVHENVAVAVAFATHHVLEFVDAKGRALGVAPLRENLPTLSYLDAATSTWPYERAGRGAAFVASQLPRAFTTQVSTISENSRGSVTLRMTTPVSFILGPPTDLHAKFVAIASVIGHSTLIPGDVVDVTVPDELAVTPPTS